LAKSNNVNTWIAPRKWWRKETQQRKNNQKGLWIGRCWFCPYNAR